MQSIWSFKTNAQPQSAVVPPAAPQGLHVAIIMDGNGRWAQRRGLPRTAGHHAGVSALRSVVEAASGQGVDTLTVYAFSVDNWKRPRGEVAAVMGLLKSYLERDLAALVRHGVRLTVIGRRDRIDPAIVSAIAHAECVTAGGRNLNLRVALDYSAREAIVAAAQLAATDGTRPLTATSFQNLVTPDGARDVDLLIRTSGEQRLSDFLLWECAYAELYFTDVLWPDFDQDDLADAIACYRARDRRFGGVSSNTEASVSETPGRQQQLVAATGSAS